MSAVYVDTSALVKLLVDEVETEVLREALAGTTAVSSVLAALELTAVVRRRGLEGGEALAEQILRRVRLIALSPTIIEDARTTPSAPPLRALDLLHLATARAVRTAAGIETLIAYDHELRQAAAHERFAVVTPR